MADIKSKEPITEAEPLQFKGFILDVAPIKVMVMKEKFLDQLPKPTKVDHEARFLFIGEFKVIGIAKQYAVILKEEGTGNLFQIHRADWQDYLRQSLYANMEYKDAIQKAHDEVNLLPQIFVD